MEINGGESEVVTREWGSSPRTLSRFLILEQRIEQDIEEQQQKK